MSWPAVSRLQSVFVISFVGASLLPNGQASQSTIADAHRLKTGTFFYRTLVGEKEEGQSKLTIHKNAETDTYVFSADITGAFDQQWESVAETNMHPVSATLSFSENGQRKQSFDLKYAGQRVSGFSAARRNRAARTIDDEVPSDIVDQRIDWATVLAADLKPGTEFSFEVYDPWTGISKASARVGPLEHVEVPAGSFEAYRITYRIEKNTGAETYEVLASKEKPRFMVREDFPDGAKAELIRIAP